jgi:hypothetical protein
VTVADLKREILTLEPSGLDELGAFIVSLKIQRDAEYAQEMERRLEDRRPESWIRLEDLEKELAGRNEAEG